MENFLDHILDKSKPEFDSYVSALNNTVHDVNKSFLELKRCLDEFDQTRLISHPPPPLSNLWNEILDKLLSISHGISVLEKHISSEKASHNVLSSLSRLIAPKNNFFDYTIITNLNHFIAEQDSSLPSLTLIDTNSGESDDDDSIIERVKMIQSNIHEYNLFYLLLIEQVDNIFREKSTSSISTPLYMTQMSLTTQRNIVETQLDYYETSVQTGHVFRKERRSFKKRT